jgi:hypothetical protein
MTIKGIEGMTAGEIEHELQRGGRFVVFHYTISILVMTFRRPSDVYFVRAGESAVARGLGFTLITLVAGWWGIPWGPIYSISSLSTNFGGGKDVTDEVRAALAS